MKSIEHQRRRESIWRKAVKSSFTIFSIVVLTGKALGTAATSRLPGLDPALLWAH